MTERPETIRLRNEATAARSHREQMHRERAWRERMLEAEADARMAARKKEAVQLDADAGSEYTVTYCSTSSHAPGVTVAMSAGVAPYPAHYTDMETVT